MGQKGSYDVLTVTPNPAVDWTLRLEELRVGAVHRVGSDCTRAGGKGVNVAGWLAQSGCNVGATGFLGEDNASVFACFFQERGIADHFIRLPGKTRTGIKIVDAHATTDLNFAGLAPSVKDRDDLLRKVADCESRWLILAGSLPPGLDADFYKDLIGREQPRQRKVLVDASGHALRKAIDARPDVIKPNIDELQELLGKRLDTRNAVAAAARQIVSAGVKLVVVSMGAQGALAIHEQGGWHSQPPPVQMGSSVGAGDAMVAGLVTGFLRRQPLEDCLRMGTEFSLRAICAIPEQLRDNSQQIVLTRLGESDQ